MNWGGIVKKLNVLAVTVAMLFVPVAFAGDLGGVVRGPNHVQGEKLDSGLGELTQQEINRVVAASQQTASSGATRSPSMRTQNVMKVDYKVPPSNEGE